LLKGYQGKILRVDLTRRAFVEEQLAPEDLEGFLGGRGLAALYYFNEIGPEVDALSEANKLIFMTGPLTATPLVGTTKFQLSTRSPETRMYLCSNCGGDFGIRLKQAGYDGLIVEGRAADWTWLSIVPGAVGFHDARPWKGYSSRRTLEVLHGAFGVRAAGAMAIGPAGEHLVRISCINVDERAFGRGGPGAVMGSKLLKGVLVRGEGTVPLADPGRVEEIGKAALRALSESNAADLRLGTSRHLEPINELGCMPTRNFQTGTFEKMEKVDAFAMREYSIVRNSACAHCAVACGKTCVVKEGPFAGAHARTEFESIALLGPNCGVADFGAIVKAAQLCDDLGIDTMSAGHAVALVMELSERGLISRDDTGGIDARFGDPEALIGIIGLLGERRAIGDLLAEGMYHVKRARPEWSCYILAVKGMPFAGYDPRGFHGNALTYGTSSRGACHNTGGWTIGAELQDGAYDRFALKGKGSLVKAVQDGRAYLDSIGVCATVRGAFGFTDSPTGDVLEAATGHPFTAKLLGIAERIYGLERLILNREGIRRRDDLLPERITKEMIPSGSTRGRILTEEMYAVMLDEYYAARGWDSDGVVTRETIRSLGLELLVERKRQESKPISARSLL